MLYHVHIEFEDLNGFVQERTFDRAHMVVSEHDLIHIRQGDTKFMLRDMRRLVFVEIESLESRCSDKDRESLDETCRILIEERKRITAIKLVRNTLGLGLREAKEYVDERWPSEKRERPGHA